MRTRNHEILEGWDSEDTNRVVRRLATAGWLTGMNVVRPGISVLHFSEKGKWAMNELGKLIVPHIRAFASAQQAPQPESTDFSQIISVVWNTAPGLMTPPLTDREGLAFVSLVLLFALKNKNGGRAYF
jgi:hypothetical protein